MTMILLKLVLTSFGKRITIFAFFRKLHPFVQYKLFQAYCTSLYGCEVWLLTNHNIDGLCVAWRKSLRRVWNLPSCTHSRLLPLISKCLPLFDEICRRSLTFVRMCVLHESPLIRSVARYGVLYVRGQSILGQNVLFCTQRYHRSIHDVICSPVDSIINSFAFNSVDFETHMVANLLTETIMITDNALNFSGGFSLSFDELNEIINYIRTS
jgi:hypothetical protein